MRGGIQKIHLCSDLLAAEFIWAPALKSPGPICKGQIRRLPTARQYLGRLCDVFGTCPDTANSLTLVPSDLAPTRPPVPSRLQPPPSLWAAGLAFLLCPGHPSALGPCPACFACAAQPPVNTTAEVKIQETQLLVNQYGEVRPEFPLDCLSSCPGSEQPLRMLVL